MTTFKNIMLEHLPSVLYTHGVIDHTEMVELDRNVANKCFRRTDAIVRQLPKIFIHYNADLWSQVTKETTVTLSIPGINERTRKIAICKSIW